VQVHLFAVPILLFSVQIHRNVVPECQFMVLHRYKTVHLIFHVVMLGITISGITGDMQSVHHPPYRAV
jgi:hypothetical protein